MFSIQICYLFYNWLIKLAQNGYNLGILFYSKHRLKYLKYEKKKYQIFALL